ncbi:MAG: hypothetical protein ACXWWC_14385 [Chitinophagaceae bacterium]
MAFEMNTFISYEGLPVNSGGAHSLRQKPVDLIYSDTLIFLQKFTNCSTPIEFDLTFYSSQDGTYRTLPTLWQLIKTLGIPSYNNWNLGRVRKHFFAWNLQHKDKGKAFQILDKFSNLQENQYGPIVLSFKWHFQFIDQLTKQVLEGQNKIPIIDSRYHNSQIYLRPGQKSTMSVWLTLPFSNLNDKNKDYIKSMTNLLPFKSSNKHWRLWRKSKNENWSQQIININAANL